MCTLASGCRAGRFCPYTLPQGIPADNLKKGRLVMDQRDRDFIQENADKDPELKSLWEDHILLSKQLQTNL